MQQLPPKKLFTFLTITYNHEKYIIEHLESIKYQILTFGSEYTIDFILADDCSKDRTIELVQHWLESNRYLFNSIEILENDRNVGTAKNYCKGIRQVKTQEFKALAGDDMFAADNMFEAVSKLKDHDIVLTIIGPFNEMGVWVDHKFNSKAYSLYSYLGRGWISNQRHRQILPMTPGVFIRRSLITEEVLKFIEDFMYIEDRPLSIKLYELNNNLRIISHDKVVVLYRYHEQAVTKTSSSQVRTLFDNDNRRAYNHIVLTSDSSLVKRINTYKLFNLNIKNDKLRRLTNVEIITHRVGYLLNFWRYREVVKSIYQKSFLKNNDFLTIMKAGILSAE